MVIETVKVCDPYCIDCNGSGQFDGGEPGSCVCVTYVKPERVDDLLFKAVNPA